MSRSHIADNVKTYISQSYPAPMLQRMLRVNHMCRYLGPQNLDGFYHPKRPRAHPETDLRHLLLQIRPVGAAVHMGKATRSKGHHQILLTEYELAFDVDIKDYDEHPRYRIRQGLLCACAAEKKVCTQCWLLVEMARVSLTYLNEFYAQGAWGPLLVVFSGGKGAHFYYGSAVARALPAQTRRGLAKLFESWQRQHQQRVHVDDAFYAPLVARLDAVFVQRGLVLRQIKMEAILHAVLNQATQVRNFLATYGRLSPSEQWAKLRALAPEDSALFLCALGLAWTDLQAFSRANGTLKMPFSLHSTKPTIALPLAPRYFDDKEMFFDHERDAVRIDEGNGDLGANGRFQEACTTMSQWLDANQYPA